MKNSVGMKLIDALGERYGIQLSTSDWDVLECYGGISLSPGIIDSLCAVANRLGDETITAYEMESLHKEFKPLRTRLGKEGIRAIRDDLMSHFDLVILPDSLRCAIATTSEMETFIFGPMEFLTAVSLGGKGAE